jgi:hypothetical protein
LRHNHAQQQNPCTSSSGIFMNNKSANMRERF